MSRTSRRRSPRRRRRTARRLRRALRRARGERCRPRPRRRRSARGKRAQEAIDAALLVDVEDEFNGKYEIAMRPARGAYMLFVLLNGRHVSARRSRCSSSPQAGGGAVDAVGADVARRMRRCHLLRDEFGNELALPPVLLDLSVRLEDVPPSAAGAGGAGASALLASMSRLDRQMDLMEVPEALRAAERKRASLPPRDELHAAATASSWSDAARSAGGTPSRARSTAWRAGVAGGDGLTGAAHAPSCYLTRTQSRASSRAARRASWCAATTDSATTRATKQCAGWQLHARVVARALRGCRPCARVHPSRRALQSSPSRHTARSPLARGEHEWTADHREPFAVGVVPGAAAAAHPPCRATACWARS